MQSSIKKLVMNDKENELPIAPVSSKSTESTKTGSWKYLEPYYQDLTPPCIDRCLVGNDIVIWIRLLEEGRFEEAIQYLYLTNPFPSITGRVCPHPCEQPCNRKAFGGGIKIRVLERFLGDYALTNKIMPAWYNKDRINIKKHKIAIIGSGPAGLSAAFYLRSFGYNVSVFEKEKLPGGLLQTGIPEFRLPKKIVTQEIEKLKAIGIKFELNQIFGKTINIDDLLNKSISPTGVFDILLLAIGKSASSKLNIPGEDHKQILDGIEFLRDVNYGREVEIGNNVLVIGGGNTAIDCARTSIRLGKNVRILYRRTRKEMPAIKEEVDEAISEGVKIDFLVAPSKAIVDNGKLIALECIRMELGPPDSSGRAKPIPIKGSEFQIPADTIMKAIGEYLYIPYLEGKVGIENSQIRIVKNYQTDKEKIFACGDCANNSGTVADAIKCGREAAFSIVTFLEKPTDFKDGKVFYPNITQDRGSSNELAKFKTFNMAYFKKESPIVISRTHIKDTQNPFTEIEHTISAEDAMKEACRCFKCGTCVYCDNCRIFCPELAISFDGTKYTINYDYCKGCGVCVEECPRNALHMKEVNIETTHTS